VDGQRFDDLTKALAAGASRRAVLKRLAGGAVGGALSLLGLAGARAQDDDPDEIEISVGGGGEAGAGAKGGRVEAGDVETGGQSGSTVEVGETSGGTGGDATVVVDGGDVTHSTDFSIGADGGEATADASGGSGNTVQVTVSSPNPCAGVTCPPCQACDPASGTCLAADEGAACDDGDACTTGATCRNGVCAGGSAVACPEPQCQACDPATGTCLAANEGATCDDGDLCTQGDVCQSGVCVGTPRECPECWFCDPSDGDCVPIFAPVPIPCGTNGGICCKGECCAPQACSLVFGCLEVPPGTAGSPAVAESAFSLPYAPEEVWAAFTEREAMAAWAGASGFAPRVGHRFRVAGDATAGAEGSLEGEVVELAELRRLAVILRGGHLPAPTTFSVSFEPLDGGTGTRLSFQHTGTGPATCRAARLALGKGWQRRIFQDALPRHLGRFRP
jgi:uncharacterized protein YndB with AHSA1/START domain